MLRALIVLLALSAGGAAAWLVATTQGQETQAAVVVAEPPPPAPMAEVLVAVDDILPGDALDDARMEWRAWPEEALNEGYVTRADRPAAVEELSGAMARGRFVAGEPIHEAKLVATDGGYLSAILAPGRRAVAVRVSAENSAGGFILPNDHVDVLHTTTSTRGDGGTTTISRTLLRNIRVLAIDQNAIENESEAIVGKTATLDLDPRQTEIITEAEATGTLSLVLRSLADNAEPQPAMEPVVAAAPPPAAPPVVEAVEPPPAAAPDPRSLRIFRSGQAETVILR